MTKERITLAAFFVFALAVFPLNASTDATTDDVPSGWPLLEKQGKIMSNQGERRDPFTGEKKFHEGVDIAARMGAPVITTITGTVIKSGHVGHYGIVVVIESANGHIIRFAHLSETLVAIGDAVNKGDVVAKVGATGRATAPHLHYEIHFDGELIDPLTTFEYDFSKGREQSDR